MNSNENKEIKVGILTFHRAHNYGAVLQCYALQETLLELGFDAEVIDYVPKFMTFYKIFQWKRIELLHPKSALKYICGIWRRKARYQAFNNFITQNYRLSDVNSIFNLNEIYDVVIIGSDQVWNPNISLGNYDNYYWGQFKIDGKPYLISYAASMGGSWKTANWNTIRKLLGDFDAISIREEHLRNLIKEKCGKNAMCVLDPTLLQTNDFWASKAKNVGISKPYLLFYQARRDIRAQEYAKNAAREMNLEFICISADIMARNSKVAIISGPEEFLGLIKYASYVITTSFHGTVFCYQYKKNFSTLKLEDGEDSRAESLMRLLHLEDHIITLREKPVVTSPNWREVDEILSNLRKESINYITDNVKNKE